MVKLWVLMNYLARVLGLCRITTVEILIPPLKNKPGNLLIFCEQGRFEILSLSGSFLLSENGGHRSRTGGLSVSLAGPDGRVLGGGVAGLLTAASPVQVFPLTSTINF
jgi:hypothetical protein